MICLQYYRGKIFRSRCKASCDVWSGDLVPYWREKSELTLRVFKWKIVSKVWSWAYSTEWQNMCKETEPQDVYKRQLEFLRVTYYSGSLLICSVSYEFICVLIPSIKLSIFLCSAPFCSSHSFHIPNYVILPSIFWPSYSGGFHLVTLSKLGLVPFCT